MRYRGGKGKCYQQLINLIPPHDSYIESHLGGGAVLRHKKPARRNIGIDRDPQVIRLWRQDYPQLCELVEADAATYLKSQTFTGNDLVYADPPYMPATRRRARVYVFDYSTEDHEQLLKVLCELPSMVMVSGYDNDLYNDMLSAWRKVSFYAKTHTDVRKECVWLNFPPAQRLHDARFIGQTFRDRQSSQRRQQRLKERIQRLDPVERSEFVRWVTETYSENGG